MSEYKADYNYDSDIEYIVKLYRSTDILCAGPFKTLNDLFNDLSLPKSRIQSMSLLELALFNIHSGACSIEIEFKEE